MTTVGFVLFLSVFRDLITVDFISIQLVTFC